MKNILRSAAALSSALLLSAAAHAQTTLYGITNANAIFTISDMNNPGSIAGPFSITGVASGQALVGIDSRTSDARLYALGYDSIAHTAELYTLSASGTTYTATAVSGTLASMDLGTTNNVALDFVGTASDQLRVIGRNGNHYMMNAVNGTVMATGSGALSFAAGDLHASSSAVLAATAYTNSFYGSDATQQVGYDAANNTLVTFDAGSYNNGFNNAATGMHTIGATGVGAVLLTTGSMGMDTWYDSLSHSNTVYLTGSTLLSGAHLYKYNLSGATGIMTDLGAIGSGTLSVRDIAFATSRDSASAIAGHLVTGLSLNLRNLLYFDSENPGNIRRVVSLNGMAAGQAMVGIDYATNGALYGLGYNSSAHTYQLYTIDSATGHVTAVNSTAGSLNLGTDNGSGDRINVGFRFVTTAANRIRVIGNNGATNVQLDATTGAIAATDAATQYVTGDASFGAAANITSIAYTGYQGDDSTQLFGFDGNTGAMIMFNVHNDNTGWGDGATGYINTGLNLGTTLSLLLHTNLYNNSHMNIMFDQATNANLGFMASNYYGDSSYLNNYSVFYDMSSMLTAYHKGTAAGPSPSGSVGYGIPVKDITMRRAYTAGPSTGVNPITGTNTMLVYPNPVLSNTHIILPNQPKAQVSVDIIDLNGRVARSYSYAPGTYSLDVDMSTLPSGIYSLRVYGADVAYRNVKIVKEQN